MSKRANEEFYLWFSTFPMSVLTTSILRNLLRIQQYSYNNLPFMKMEGDSYINTHKNSDNKLLGKNHTEHAWVLGKQNNSSHLNAAFSD